LKTLVRTYPPAVKRDRPLEGKFLQLRLGARECLLFADRSELRYHNQILARFLSEQAIPYHWESPEKLVVDHPALSVTGGGRFLFDPTRRIMHLWDESSVYGPFDVSRMGTQLAAAGPPWNRIVLSAV